MVKKKRTSKTICFYCKKEILRIPSERSVLVITSEGANVIESVRFHIDCWCEYFNGKVTEKHNNLLKNILENPLVPDIMKSLVMPFLQSQKSSDSKKRQKRKNDRRKNRARKRSRSK